MKNFNIFIDTNILLDYICKREPHYESAKKLLKLCSEGKIFGTIAAHSIGNIDYISQKQYSAEERRTILKSLCQFLEVDSIDKEKIISAIDNEDFKDLEDGLQYECALSQNVDYIITRNEKDFSSSEIPVVSAEEFLNQLSA